LGPVQTVGPAREEGRMAVGVFARLQHTPGIRQWDPEAENWVPIYASIGGPRSETGSRSPRRNGGLFLLRLRQQRPAQRPGKRRHRARLSFTAGSALSARGCSHWATTWMNFRRHNQI